MPLWTAVALWAVIGIGGLSSWFIDVPFSERVTRIPPDLKIPDNLRDRLSIENGENGEYETITLRLGVWSDIVDREAILALSSDHDLKRAINSIYERKSRLLLRFIVAGGVVLIIGFELFNGSKNKQFAASLDKFHDLRLVLLILVGACIATVFLLQAGSFTTSPDPGRGFWQAHVEFFLVCGLFLAIIGAVYAVVGKYSADQATAKSQEVLLSMAAFFMEYEEIFNEDNKRSVPRLIRESKKSLTMFLGSPVVGYFRNEEFGRTFADELAKKAKTRSGGFDITFLYFNFEPHPGSPWVG
jgi:hypothetical protein